MVKKLPLFLLMLLSACTTNTSTETMRQPTHSIRLLALGDSYTSGAGVEPPESWPFQLSERLYQSGIETADMQVIAQNGWATEDLLAGMEAANLQGEYDLVVLLIGVNNQFRMYGIDQYREEFGLILGRAIRLAGDDPTRVVVLSIPDWSVTPFAAGYNVARIGAEINTYNDINRESATQTGAGYVDVTGISRQAARDRSLLARDGLHPAGKMYAMWVDEMLPVILLAVGVRNNDPASRE
ncbi:MAG: SGNH/GDSL hydrolase family protein [Anaerolineales bacterium]|nr:SGNH/GDSL hydrolase family protein [Anaerolineales bacterium]